MSGSFLTPKALANRMKSKGLQRLRWYCQMCEKQCFGLDTRVLTNHGFLFLDELCDALDFGVEVKFAAYDKDSEELLYVTGQLLVKPAAENGRLVSFADPSEDARLAHPGVTLPRTLEERTNHTSIRVTADHDMFVQQGARKPGKHFRQRNNVTIPHETISAGQLLRDDKAVRFMASAANGVRPPFSTFTLADVLGCSLGLPAHCVDPFVELYGFWLGDGSLGYSLTARQLDGAQSSSHRTSAVLFHQKKVDDVAYVPDQLRKCGLTANDYSVFARSDGRQPIEVHKREWFAYFDQSYGSKYRASDAFDDEAELIKSAKWLLWWVLVLCTPAQCKLILLGLLRADGTWASQDKCIYTASVRFRDELVQLALHAGYSARFSCDYEKGSVRGYKKQGDHTHIYRKPEEGKEHLFKAITAKHDLWNVHYTDCRRGSGTVWPLINWSGDGIKEEPYDGETWCVTVDHPHHLIVAQRALRDANGRVYKAAKPIIIGQCRDENGFKCHTRTEAHLRQMSLFAQSADSFVERFSRQFCDGYVAVLRRQGGRQVKANHVYTQYIGDKQHVHMNATKWDTLSSFVSYLGKQRLADVEQDEHGDWLVKYVDRDPKALARQQEADSRAGRERSREQQEAERIEAEMAAATSDALRRQTEQTDSDGATEERVKRDAEDERRQREWLSGDSTAPTLQPVGRLTIAISRPNGGSTHPVGRGAAEKTGGVLLRAASTQQAEAEGRQSAAAASSAAEAGRRKRSAVELIMDEEQQRKQRAMASPQSHRAPQPTSAPSPSRPVDAPWLSAGLVVKLLNRSVQSGRYYGQKGGVMQVEDGGYTAVVAPSDLSLPTLRVDQHELQTVIPAIGHAVRIVAGSRRRGETATLCALSADQTTCTVECVSDGQQLAGMEFENVCKLIVDSSQQSAQ